MSQQVVFVARYEEGEYDCYCTGIVSIHKTKEAAVVAADKYREIQLGHWPYNCTVWVDELPLED